MHSPGPKSGQRVAAHYRHATNTGEEMISTDNMVKHILFKLSSAAAMIDTLSAAVVSANFALGADAPSMTPENAEVVKRLEADYKLYLTTTRNALHNAEQWTKAMQDNSVVMLRFQRYVDEHIGTLPL